MNIYTTDKIRNVVLLGHGGSGKARLTEAMAYLAGMTSRLGRVEDGNTVSDLDMEEIKSNFSFSTSVLLGRSINSSSIFSKEAFSLSIVTSLSI